LLSAFTPVLGVDLTGRWSASASFEGRQILLVFDFIQEGSSVTGVCGLRPDFMSAVQAVRVEGNAIEIDFQLPAGPPIKVSGVLEADTISGEAKLPVKPFTAKFEMKRAGPVAKLPSTGTTEQNPIDLASLSDEFDSDASLKGWKTLSETEGLPNRVESVEIAGGNLSIVPRSGAWWAGYHGIYLFKEVKGDFAITTRVKVTGRTAEEPTRIWTISGLLVRKAVDAQSPPGDVKENWIYVMTGRGPEAARVVDAKSTVANSNQWDITPAQPGWYELRVARLGPLFVILVRPDGGAWSVRKRIFREDFPESLQAGINVTSDFDVSVTMPASKYNSQLFPESKTDGLTKFDYVRFARVDKTPLADRELLRIPDEELLELLK